MLDLLVGTGEFAGAAGASALLAGRGLLAHHVGVQRARTFRRKVILLLPTRLVRYYVHHLRNDVAGALDDDGVADPDIAALAQLLAMAADSPDVILVVQRDVLHDDAADADRLKLADRRERAGAPDLNLDIPEHGHGALGRKLVGDRPARRARHEAEALLPVDAIDLVDDAIDVVVEMRPLGFYLAMESEQLFDGIAKLGERIGLEAAALEPFDHARLGIFRHFAHLAPGIGKEAERARGGDLGVLLPQRACRRIAGIGEDGIAGGLLPLVEREKCLLGHVDFAAHLADLRHVAAFELFRYVLKRADIGGDVFAHGPVAACRGGDEFASFITQRHRQSVDLRLGAERYLVVVAEFQEAPDTGDEIDDVGLRKGIVERQHRHRVADFGEASGRLRTDFLRRRLAGDEFGKSGFDCIEALAQRVILGIRNLRRIFLIVGFVVALDFKREPFQLDLGLRLGEGVDVREIFGLCYFSHAASGTRGFTPLRRAANVRRRRGLRR